MNKIVWSFPDNFSKTDKSLNESSWLEFICLLSSVKIQNLFQFLMFQSQNQVSWACGRNDSKHAVGVGARVSNLRSTITNQG